MINTYWQSFTNWMFGLSKPLDGALHANLAARLKEITFLSKEQAALNDLYRPFNVVHPTKLSEKIDQFITEFMKTGAANTFQAQYKLPLSQFHSLSVKDRVYHFLNSPVQGKSILELFNQTFDIPPPSYIAKLPSSHPFYDTDLVVYQDDYSEALPINGIYQKDLKLITEMFHQFLFTNKVQIIGNYALKMQFLGGIKKLLTRPTSRKLLLSIFRPSFKQKAQSWAFGYTDFELRVMNHPQASYLHSKENQKGVATFSLFLCLTNPKQVYNESDGNQTEKSPFYITLAHELIHLKHYLYHQEFKESSFDEIKDFTNAYEKVTITGTLGGEVKDSICENAIRKEFGFYPRRNHLGVDVDYIVQ